MGQKKFKNFMNYFNFPEDLTLQDLNKCVALQIRKNHSSLHIPLTIKNFKFAKNDSICFFKCFVSFLNPLLPPQTVLFSMLNLVNKHIYALGFGNLKISKRKYR